MLVPIGFSVSEPAEMTDGETGSTRELDVLISGEFLGVKMQFGVEARDEARKADVTWLEQLRSKRESLRLNVMMAVHSRGFSKTALEKGRNYSIPCLTLREAERNDWRLAVCRFALRNLEFKILGMSLLGDAELETFFMTGAFPDRSAGEPEDVTRWRPRLKEIEHDTARFVARRAKELLADNVARDYPGLHGLPKRIGVPVALSIDALDDELSPFRGGFVVEFSVQKDQDIPVVHSSYGDDMIVVSERDAEQGGRPVLVARYGPRGVEWVKRGS
jgi:hypothetical protein